MTAPGEDGSRAPSRSIPWGTVTAAIAAFVLAAPTLLLPADGPVAPKAGFLVVGAVLLGLAIVLARREPGAPRPVDRGDATDLTR